MEQDDRQQQLMELEREVHQIAVDLDAIHKDLQSFHDGLAALERRAEAAGLKVLEFGLKDAFVKTGRAGQALVDAHVRLNLPSDAYTPAGASAPPEGARQ